MEKVDILLPPEFKKSGEIKTIVEAWESGDWIGTFNLWILQADPVPAIVYQIRSPQSTWAPNKFDVTAGGHYSAGEEIKDGLREVREELGRDYEFEDLSYLGRKLFVGTDAKGRKKNNVVDIFFVVDNSSINTYALEEKEVYAVASCPIEDLIKVHTQKNYTFEVNILTNKKEQMRISINKDSFPHNWDNYHFKIALLAQRFINGESNLIY